MFKKHSENMSLKTFLIIMLLKHLIEMIEFHNHFKMTGMEPVAVKHL